MNLPTDNPMKRRAHALLDDIRAGLYHEQPAVTWALRALGEPVHDMRHLHQLEAARERRPGEASPCHLRAVAEVEVLSAASDMPEAHASAAGSGGRAAEMAGGGA
jgi:hypothetical protein